MAVDVISVPSRQVAEALPGRCFKFLSCLSRNADMRGVMRRRGYTAAEHDLGWTLTLKVSGHSVNAPESSPLDADAREATVALDQWDEPNFRIAAAALKHNHAEQYAFVFKDLQAVAGAGAVKAVALFLQRLDALEKDPARKGSRKADQAALDKLAERGIDAAMRKQLRALVGRAMGKGTEVPVVEEAAVAAPAEAPSDDLLALYAWFAEWSEVARAVFKRRDQLIMLGLASRKSKKGGAPEPTE